MADDQASTDAFTMQSCRYLLKCFEAREGLPVGETAESVAEFIEVHRQALHVMKQRSGKAVLVLELGMLAKRFGKGSSAVERTATDPETAVREVAGSNPAPCTDPREDPLMKEAKEIFNGTWIRDPAPEPEEMDLFR